MSYKCSVAPENTNTHSKHTPTHTISVIKKNVDKMIPRILPARHTYLCIERSIPEKAH